MTVSNFHLVNKGAADVSGKLQDNQQHDFTYVVADENQSNFHAFFDEKETWINHRDNGRSLNVDAEIVNRLVTKSSNNA